MTHDPHTDGRHTHQVKQAKTVSTEASELASKILAPLVLKSNQSLIQLYKPKVYKLESSPIAIKTLKNAQKCYFEKRRNEIQQILLRNYCGRGARYKKVTGKWFLFLMCFQSNGLFGRAL